VGRVVGEKKVGRERENMKQEECVQEVSAYFEIIFRVSLI
jgi:hypothetical protein